MKKVAFHTLGCKVNMYETEAMAGLFVAKGYEIVDFEQTADVYIINTCTVTAIGDKKSRQMIRRAKKRNPNAILAVTGCYAQVAKDEVEAIEGVNLIVGTSGRGSIVELVEQSQGMNISVVGHIPTEYEDFGTGSYHSHTRATVKIQDGCDNFCSYCIIPYARGRVRSRKLDSIVSEVKTLGAQGFFEVVLVGIELASYGKDTGEQLIDVINSINQIEGIKRIRLGSLEPRLITDEFVDGLKKADKLCPHFHISLQSGCDKTLKRMNRKYNMADYFSALERIRAIPDCAVTTDIMVGFPGEKPEDFEESLKNVSDCGFSAVHVFPYSKRKGTPAATMAEQISEQTKAERAAIMAAECQKQRDRFLNSHIGKTMPVFFEEEEEGFTPNYLRVKVAGGKGFADVKITGVLGDTLRGELC